MSPILLNIGCGLTKLPGFINIDIDEKVNPDLVLDITKVTPYQDSSVDKIYFSHTIEHIPEKYHEDILEEFWRILIPHGLLFISYPEFAVCAQNYLNNYRGMREYWKHTIYGRQVSKDDFHVALMDSLFFTKLLTEVGFSPIFLKQEPNAEYNTIVKCFKGNRPSSYEDVLKKEIFGDASGNSRKSTSRSKR